MHQQNLLGRWLLGRPSSVFFFEKQIIHFIPHQKNEVLSHYLATEIIYPPNIFTIFISISINVLMPYLQIWKPGISPLLVYAKGEVSGNGHQKIKVCIANSYSLRYQASQIFVSEQVLPQNFIQVWYRQFWTFDLLLNTSHINLSDICR